MAKTKIKKNKFKKAGQSPGSLIYIGKEHVTGTALTITRYNEDMHAIYPLQHVSAIQDHLSGPEVTWLNVDGIHNAETISAVGQLFGLHALLLEDVMNTSHHAKLDDYDKYLFVVIKMLSINPVTQEVDSEQISFVLGNNFVISFQEKEGDVFTPVRHRMQTLSGRLRKSGPDYLLYCLLDVIVDNYFEVIDHIGDRLEGLEERIIQRGTSEQLQELHDLRREIADLRRMIRPVRDIMSGLERDEPQLFRPETGIFLRDISDHTMQVLDQLENYREACAGLLDVYLSAVSHRMNSVMKVLTVISTIFMPLTFIVGVYGMNFENMPELKWEWGYFGVLAIMFLLSLIMLFFFRKKRWI
jgi:magnesium transporter